VITFDIADLDFGDLSLRLAIFKVAPIADPAPCAATGAVLQTELKLSTTNSFLDCV